MKLIRIIAVPLVLLFTVHGASANINQFAGKWKNIDPNTGGLSALHIDIKGTTVGIQAWGKCHPQDCEWDYVKGTAYGPSVGANLVETAHVVSVVYVTSFSQMILIIHPIEGGQLQVEWMTNFTDQSCRASYSRVERFSRVEEAGAAR